MFYDFDCEGCDCLTEERNKTESRLEEAESRIDELVSCIKQAGTCSFCVQPFSNLIEHMDSCLEAKKVRMLVNGGWPRVCPEDGVLYDEHRADSHAALYHNY